MLYMQAFFSHMTSPNYQTIRRSLAPLLEHFDAGAEAPGGKLAARALASDIAALLIESVGQERAVELTSEVMSAIASQTGFAVARVPEALYRDPVSGLFLPTFFSTEYPRYGRGENALILLRYEMKSIEANEDQIGQLVGELVLASVRTVDVPCRWSACEFLILLPRTTVDQASIVARRIHDAPAVQRLPRGTVTIGLALARNGEPFDQVYGRASWAVYNTQVTGSDEIGVA